MQAACVRPQVNNSVATRSCRRSAIRRPADAKPATNCASSRVPTSPSPATDLWSLASVEVFGVLERCGNGPSKSGWNGDLVWPGRSTTAFHVEEGFCSSVLRPEGRASHGRNSRLQIGQGHPHLYCWGAARTVQGIGQSGGGEGRGAVSAPNSAAVGPARSLRNRSRLALPECDSRPLASGRLLPGGKTPQLARPRSTGARAPCGSRWRLCRPSGPRSSREPDRQTICSPPLPRSSRASRRFSHVSGFKKPRFPLRRS